MFFRLAAKALKPNTMTQAKNLFSRTFTNQTKMQTNTSLTTAGSKHNVFNAQRSCCPLRVCGTPACPITKRTEISSDSEFVLRFTTLK